MPSAASGLVATLAGVLCGADDAAAGATVVEGDGTATYRSTTAGEDQSKLAPSRDLRIEVLLVQCSSVNTATNVDTARGQPTADGGLPEQQAATAEESMGLAGGDADTVGALIAMPARPSVTDRWHGALPSSGPPSSADAQAARYTRGAAALQRSLRRAVEGELVLVRGIAEAEARRMANRVSVHWLPNSPAGWLAQTSRWLKFMAPTTPCTIQLAGGATCAGKGGEEADVISQLPLSLLPLNPVAMSSSGQTGQAHMAVVPGLGMPACLQPQGRVHLGPLPMQLLLSSAVLVECKAEDGANRPWSGLLQLLSATDTGLLLRGLPDAGSAQGHGQAQAQVKSVRFAGQDPVSTAQHQGGPNVSRTGPLYLLMASSSLTGGNAGGTSHSCDCSTTTAAGLTAAGGQTNRDDTDQPLPTAVLYRLASREEALLSGLHMLAGCVVDGPTRAALDEEDRRAVQEVMVSLQQAKHEGGAGAWDADATMADCHAPSAPAQAFLQPITALPCIVYDPLAHSSGAFIAGKKAYKAKLAAEQESQREAEQAARAAAKKAEANAARAASRARNAQTKATATGQADTGQAGPSQADGTAGSSGAGKAAIAQPKGRAALAPGAAARGGPGKTTVQGPAKPTAIQIGRQTTAAKGKGKAVPAVYDVDGDEDSEQDSDMPDVQMDGAPGQANGRASTSKAKAADDDDDSLDGLSSSDDDDSHGEGGNDARISAKGAGQPAARGRAPTVATDTSSAGATGAAKRARVGSGSGSRSAAKGAAGQANAASGTKAQAGAGPAPPARRPRVIDSDDEDEGDEVDTGKPSASPTSAPTATAAAGTHETSRPAMPMPAVPTAIPKKASGGAAMPPPPPPPPGHGARVVAGQRTGSGVGTVQHSFIPPPPPPPPPAASGRRGGIQAPAPAKVQAATQAQAYLPQFAPHGYPPQSAAAAVGAAAGHAAGGASAAAAADGNHTAVDDVIFDDVEGLGLDGLRVGGLGVGMGDVGHGFDLSSLGLPLAQAYQYQYQGTADQTGALGLDLASIDLDQYRYGGTDAAAQGQAQGLGQGNDKDDDDDVPLGSGRDPRLGTDVDMAEQAPSVATRGPSRAGNAQGQGKPAAAAMAAKVSGRSGGLAGKDVTATHSSNDDHDDDLLEDLPAPPSQLGPGAIELLDLIDPSLFLAGSGAASVVPTPQMARRKGGPRGPGGAAGAASPEVPSWALRVAAAAAAGGQADGEEVLQKLMAPPQHTAADQGTPGYGNAPQAVLPTPEHMPRAALLASLGAPTTGASASVVSRQARLRALVHGEAPSLSSMSALVGGAMAPVGYVRVGHGVHDDGMVIGMGPGAEHGFGHSKAAVVGTTNHLPKPAKGFIPGAATGPTGMPKATVLGRLAAAGQGARPGRSAAGTPAFDFRDDDDEAM